MGVRRVMIIGTSCCGKTTLGKRLSQILEIPFTDLDDLHWSANWEPRSETDFLSDVEKVAAKDKWIITGNYSKTSPITWPRADLLIWLDLPLYRLLYLGLKRSLHRITFKVPVCNGNYESWSRLLSSHSILWWVITTYRERKRRYDKFFGKAPAQPKQTRLRFRSHGEVASFLNQFSSSECKAPTGHDSAR